MAARNLKRNISHFTPEPVMIFGKATGAAAADLTALTGPGIASIKYNAATGKLKVTLEDKYSSLLWCAGQVIDTTAIDDWEVNVESEDVAGAKTISLGIFKGGTLTDLTTDEKLMLCIVCSNRSATR